MPPTDADCPRACSSCLPLPNGSRLHRLRDQHRLNGRLDGGWRMARPHCHWRSATRCRRIQISSVQSAISGPSATTRQAARRFELPARVLHREGVSRNVVWTTGVRRRQGGHQPDCRSRAPHRIAWQYQLRCRSTSRRRAGTAWSRGIGDVEVVCAEVSMCRSAGHTSPPGGDAADWTNGSAMASPSSSRLRRLGQIVGTNDSFTTSSDWRSQSHYTRGANESVAPHLATRLPRIGVATCDR